MTKWLHIEKSELSAMLSKLQETWDVFAVVEVGKDRRIRELPTNGNICLKPRKPLVPLKMLFLPEVEDILAFSIKGKTSQLMPIEPPSKERLVLGALGCDIAALEILDQIFLQDPLDSSYLKRKDQTTLIALQCPGEGPECFCTSLGIDPLQPAGADVLVSEVAKAYLLKSLTKKGDHVLEAIHTLLREPSDKELSAIAALIPIPTGDVSADEISEKYNELWDLSLWDDLAARCLGCGVCTVLCPTCYCFEVEDERRGSSGKRFRAWDSCMSSCFTKMASGENPRPTRRERIRHRFLHKLNYFPQTKGQVACVGCGRCAVHCPVGIDIREVIVALGSLGLNHG